MIKRKLSITVIKALIKVAIENSDKIPDELKEICGDTTDDLLDIADDVLEANAGKVCKTVNAKIDGILEDSDISDEKIDNIKAEICDLLIAVQNDLTLDLLCDKKQMGCWLQERFEKSGKARSEYEEIPMLLPRVGKILCTQFQKSQDFVPQMLIDNRIKLIEIAKGNIQLIEEGKITRENQNEILRLLKDVLEKLSNFGREDVEEPFDSVQSNDYKARWKKNMFLNDYDEATPAAKYNLSLAQLYGSLDNYLLPYATWGYRVPDELNPFEEEISPDTLKNHLLDDQMLGRGLVILGMPGIGKSTLVSWYCNSKTRRTVRAFSLPSLVRKSVSTYEKKEIISWLNLSEIDLKESVLILDGLDEVSFIQNKEQFVNEVFNSLRTIKNLSIIITCRVNYINTYKLQPSYFILHPWNTNQINTFVEKFKNFFPEKDFEQKRLVLKKKPAIYGIPLITYMVVATNIMAQETDTEADIYDKLFALKGGIFDHQINRMDIDNPRPLNEETKEKILDKSREIAFWMFEHYGENDIPDVFNQIDGLKDNHFYRDFFKVIRHTEGTAHMSFVHRSMYEYFAVDYLIHEVSLLLENGVSSGKDLEEYSPQLAYILAKYCKKGYIDESTNANSLIYSFLNVKLNKLLNSKKLMESSSDKFKIYAWFEKSAALIFQKGCLYYAYRENTLEKCRNTLFEEARCSRNILLLLKIVYRYYNPQFQHDMNKMFSLIDEKGYLTDYITFFSTCNGTYFPCVDLSNTVLRFAELSDADFRNARLSNADLYSARLNSARLNSAILFKAIFTNADMRKANMSNADLRQADLRKANMSDVNLRNANLCMANLRYADLRNADLREADLRNAVLRDADLCNTNFEESKIDKACFSSTYYSRIGSIKVNTFPIPSLHDANFLSVFVNGYEYDRKEFFEKFG